MEMRKEAGLISKNHIEKRLVLGKNYQDLYDASQVSEKHRANLREDMYQAQMEVVKLSQELNLLQVNFRKKDTLLTKYIQSLAERASQTKIDSYWKLNPGLITETEFEIKFQEELLRVIRSKYYGEELFEKENVVTQYFKQAEKREKSLQELRQVEIKLNKEIEVEENSYNTLCNEYKKIQEQIVIETSKFEDILYNRENIINTRVENRNNGLKSHLKTYLPDEYEKYLKVNKNLHKQVLKMFSSQPLQVILSSSGDRDKLIELVVDDHSTKKNKYFDLISDLIAHDAKFADSEQTKDNINSDLVKKMVSFNELKNEISRLENEMKLLNTSKTDLREKIESTLKSQIGELQADKKDLQVKHSVNYYFFKVKEIGEKIEELKNRLKKSSEDYEKFNEEYFTLIENLNKEDLDIKKELILLGVNNGFKIPVVEDKKDAKSVKTFGGSKRSSVSKLESFKKDKNDDGLKKSIIGKQAEIDFTKTVNRVKELHKITDTNINMAISDLEIYDSRIPKIEEEVVINNEDPFFISSVEKILKLIKGMKVYKKMGESSKFYFNMLTSVEFPPESTGFVLRDCSINVREEQIEIRKGKLVENKLPFKNLKGMILSNHSRALIKYIKTGVKPSLFCVPEADKLIECKYVPIQIMLEKSSVDLIMPDYESFADFSEAYEELMKIKSKAKRIIKYLENTGKI